MNFVAVSPEDNEEIIETMEENNDENLENKWS